MKITVISANSTNRKDLKTDKGQSFFIETLNRRLIYDFGSDRTMVNNMEKLGISPDVADMGYLSCGNTRHSGGIVPFALRNSHAVIYARSNAFLPHYQKSIFGKKDVTPDKRLHRWKRMIHCKNYTIDESGRLVTFSLTEFDERVAKGAVRDQEYFIKGEGGNFLPDDFSHEMYLLVKEGECWTLFCGEAHAGIVDIVNRAEYLINCKLGGKLTAVVGAWSLMANKKPVGDELMDEVANGLKDKNVIFYTGHTTGEYAFNRMKGVLGDKVRYYSAGDEIVL